MIITNLCVLIFHRNIFELVHDIVVQVTDLYFIRIYFILRGIYSASIRDTDKYL